MRNLRLTFSCLTFLRSATLSGCLLGLFFGSGLLWGQGFTAEVLGIVTDNSGAVVPQAIVTATNTGTGQNSAVVTDANGAYTIPKLTPGVYNISVEMQGFKRGVRDSLTLQVD